MINNLIRRIITSIILLIILIIINFSHRYIFIGSILIISAVLIFEFNNIFLKIKNNHSVNQNFISKKINLKFLFLNFLTFCYIFFVFCNISYELHNKEGPIFFLYIVSICFFTDIGGYIVGKVVGGKKLTKISPNKTISGTIGSFIFCLISLFLFINISDLDLELNFKNILFILIISLISQIGDLFISYLKRKAKIKDTGNLLPGHGGVLDRLDGIIFALPFSYFLLKFI